MKNNEISLDVFETLATETLATEWQGAEMPTFHEHRLLCRIVLTLISDVRELTAALAVATEARAIEGERRK